VLDKDTNYFLELQTQTGWGRTLYGFAKWCEPKPGWLALDVGCGPGLLPAIISSFGSRAVGVDIDPHMFAPAPLHPVVAVAEINNLPFPEHTFDLVTVSNLLFLLPQPLQALREVKRALRSGGKLAMLNPSEYLSVDAADAFAKEQGLEGLSRDTMLNWAQRAEANHRWTDAETQSLYENAGLRYGGDVLKIGANFGRFSWGTA
jgi:ubiquinone/menaquinone biosynthesis C-methylase UbiE